MQVKVNGIDLGVPVTDEVGLCSRDPSVGRRRPGKGEALQPDRGFRHVRRGGNRVAVNLVVHTAIGVQLASPSAVANRLFTKAGIGRPSRPGDLQTEHRPAHRRAVRQVAPWLQVVVPTAAVDRSSAVAALAPGHGIYDALQDFRIGLAGDKVRVRGAEPRGDHVCRRGGRRPPRSPLRRSVWRTRPFRPSAAERPVFTGAGTATQGFSAAALVAGVRSLCISLVKEPVQATLDDGLKDVRGRTVDGMPVVLDRQRRESGGRCGVVTPAIRVAHEVWFVVKVVARLYWLK